MFFVKNGQKYEKKIVLLVFYNKQRLKIFGNILVCYYCHQCVRTTIDLMKT